ncbi:hypothetical protein HYC85_005312 [Camellia sinensis]|uniref:RING-type domain-containing protein n=1 Tax=Camellia sinensis TaxID=4442 RepID=A0A7J7I0B5_CAMSI|nr:hypothetical protein HYC85_005312 [Camellia sinensis]
MEVYGYPSHSLPSSSSTSSFSFCNLIDKIRSFRDCWECLLCDLHFFLRISGHLIRSHDWSFDRPRDRERIDVIASLLSGRLVRERIGPAMLSAVQSQMGAVEPSFDEVHNIFDTGSAKGLPGDSVERIPKIKITSNNNVDASGEKASCSVCLQDFQVGETVRSLPHCHHMFHLPCIDKWLNFSVLFLKY